MMDGGGEKRHEYLSTNQILLSQFGGEGENIFQDLRSCVLTKIFSTKNQCLDYSHCAALRAGSGSRRDVRWAPE